MTTELERYARLREAVVAMELWPSHSSVVPQEFIDIAARWFKVFEEQAARAAPALHIDDAECVMYDALQAAHQRGPVTDDKILLEELAKRGVVLARAAPAQPETENSLLQLRIAYSNGVRDGMAGGMAAPAQPAGERVLLVRSDPPESGWRECSDHSAANDKVDGYKFAWATIERIQG